MLKKLITLTAITGALALPALADDIKTANPSRPDLDQPSAQQPASDVKSRDIQQDRGMTGTGTGTMKAPATPMPRSGVQAQADVNGISDDEVLSRLHAIDQQEIDLANVATQKGKLPEVKNFAQMMIKDHQKADADLMKFAKDRNIAIREPRALNDADAKSMQDDKNVAQQVRNASGADFDRIYANAMLQGHADAIAMVEEAAKMTKNAPVKGFYEKLLPTLRMHRDHAADIVATIQTQGVGGTSGSTGAGTSDDSAVQPGAIDKKDDVKSDDVKKDDKNIDKDYGKKNDSRIDQ